MKICPLCKRFFNDAYTICRFCGLENGKSAPYLVPANMRKELKRLAKSLNRS